uniref:Beta/gamma crystallin 'Greek key' domain-containing protein n=1 Tax=Hucho hucho TaxID=62062 RepID=A0A4W5N640_9TELE
MCLYIGGGGWAEDIPCGLMKYILTLYILIPLFPQVFSVPSISLFGLECLEGREITVDTEVVNMLEEGYNNHLLSVRVNRGCWVLCEHSNYRGRQLLLEPIEITNWPKFSQLLTIGSMYPVRQVRIPLYFLRSTSLLHSSYNTL